MKGRLNALLLLLFVCCSVALGAEAANRLDFVQMHQNNSVVKLYLLMSDIQSNAAVSISAAPEMYKVYARGVEMTPDKVELFSNADENTAYVIVLDTNSYALRSNSWDKMCSWVQALLLNMRSDDRVLVLVAGKTTVSDLTYGFESDFLKVSKNMEEYENSDRGGTTQLYKAMDQAIDAFYTTDDSFPARKMMVVFGYGNDDSAISSEALAEKAHAAGIPIYTVAIPGKASDGSVRNGELSELDMISRASRGRLLRATSKDLEPQAAAELINDYVEQAVILTVQPDATVWQASAADWSVAISINGETVQSRVEDSFSMILAPTASPAPDGKVSGMILGNLVESLLLTDIISNTSQSITVDNSGFYEVSGLVPGDYRLSFQIPEYKKMSDSEQWRMEGQVCQYTFELQPNEHLILETLELLDAVSVTPTPFISALPASVEDDSFDALLERLMEPPLLYVFIGIVLLLLLLLIIAATAVRKNHKRKQLEIQAEEERFEKQLRSSFGDEGIEHSIPLGSRFAGDETIGLFADDPNATLPMTTNCIVLDLQITYQGKTMSRAATITHELTIGRNQNCNICLEDPHISREHLKFQLEPTGLFLTDLGSRSGTKLNNDLICEKTSVKDGDKIEIGTTVIDLHIRQ